MKYTHSLLPWTGLFLALLSLSSCSVNTKFDDADYRPVGASDPLNSKIHTLEETKTLPQETSAESPNTRYIKPGETNRQAEPGNQTLSSKSIPARVTAEKTQPQATRIKKSTTHVISESINNIFKHRYGSRDLILKIAKTVQIHCQHQPLETNHSVNSGYKLCSYQFPGFCGAHRFSLILNNKQQLLMYTDQNYQRNIIDTLTGNGQSNPGLWDKDDYVSSKLLTVSQLLGKHSGTAAELGWIVETSSNEKAQLGRSYLAALKETSKCF